MTQDTKDIIDVCSKVVSALGFIVAAVAFTVTLRVRRQDLRWRMASAAHDAFSDIHKNPYAVVALEMIDCVRWQENCDAKTRAGIDKPITPTMITAALAENPHPTSEEKAVRTYVRQCFDWLLYYMDRVAYQATVGFLVPDDFAAPLKPYTKFVHEHWSSFDNLAKEQNYTSLRAEIARFGKRE